MDALIQELEIAN